MTHLTFVVEPGGALRGRLRVPGDKSISHRAIMLGSLAEGTTIIVTSTLSGMAMTMNQPIRPTLSTSVAE